MDKGRIAGSAKQIKGALKQAVGKALGDTKLQSEGRADKIEGQIQNAVGGLKDTLRGKRSNDFTCNSGLTPRTFRRLCMTVLGSHIPAARALAPCVVGGALALLLQVPAARADTLSAQTFVQQNVDKEIAILKDTKLAEPERETQSRALLRSIIDVKRLAMFALGSYARNASERQIDGFESAFSDYFFSIFHFNLEQSSGGRSIAVTGATARGVDDVIVTASVAGADARSPAGTPMNLGFRVRKNAAGEDTIVDVLVGTISMAVTQRDDFSSYLRQHGGNIDQLSAELEKRAAAN